MTHWKQNFNYKYTGAYELAPGEERTRTIQRTNTEDVVSTDGKSQKCFVAYFKDEAKPMVLNKTNCKTLAKLYGPQIEDWVGKAIIIKAEQVKAFGEVVDALRIKNVKPVQSIKDYSICEFKLKACKTLDELKAVYSSLTKEEQAGTSLIKDQLKANLK